MVFGSFSLLAAGLSVLALVEGLYEAAQNQEATTSAGVWKPSKSYICVYKNNAEGKMTKHKCLVSLEGIGEARLKNSYTQRSEKAKDTVGFFYVLHESECRAESAPESFKMCELKDENTADVRVSGRTKQHIPDHCFDVNKKVEVQVGAKAGIIKQKLLGRSTSSRSGGIKVLTAIEDWKKCPEGRYDPGKPTEGDADLVLDQDESEEAEEANECAVERLKNVCKCGHTSRKGKQCSQCFDPTKWGYGCDLDCPAECTRGCTFEGECNVKVQKPKNCKRNGRAAKPTDKSVAVNTRGECQACDRGFHGLYCQHKCPANCKESIEGGCTRSGKCYQCQPGFYGVTCEEACPAACPNCLMVAGKVEGWDEELPAGSCDQVCEGNKYGAECEKQCDAKCATGKPGKPSCRRQDGQCLKCPAGKWGKLCDTDCKQCKDGTCGQLDGFCDSHKGCKAGFWGQSCENTCPAGTFSSGSSPGTCDFDNGFPALCVDKKFPQLAGVELDMVKLEAKGGVGRCADCPRTCKDQMCKVWPSSLYQKGKCTGGCEDGFYGKECESKCPENCVGGCTQDEGVCNACAPGFTGKHCANGCHRQCQTCRQYGSAGGTLHPRWYGKPAGTTAQDCLSCDKTQEPVDFHADSGTCVCHRDATRPAENDLCKCVDPEGEQFRYGYFDPSPDYQRCRIGCVPSTREVIGCFSSDCIKVNVFLAAIRSFPNGVPAVGSADDTKGKDGCAEDMYPVKAGDEFMGCLKEDYVRFITGEDITEFCAAKKN